MAYIPLTEEQYNSARKAGFSPDRIIEMEKQRKSQQDVQPQQQGTFLDKLGGGLDAVFGGGKIGEAIGSVLAKTGLVTGGLDLTQQEKASIHGPSAEALAGDVAGVGLTLASLGLPAGLASKVGLKAISPLGGKAASVLGRIGESALLGGGFGVAGAMKGEKDLGGIAKSGIGGAALGGAVQGVGEGASKLIDVLQGTVPKRIVQGVVKSEKDVTSAALNKKVGTTQNVFNQSKQAVKDYSKQIDTILQGEEFANSFISKKSLLKSVAQSYGQTGGGGTITSAEIQKIITKTAPQAKGLLSKDVLNVVEANKLRKIVDKTLGSRFYLATQPPFTKEVLGTFNDFLRGHVKDTAKATIPIFAELTKEITLRDALQTALKAKANKGLNVGLKDIFSILGGSLVGGLPGAAAGLGLERASQSKGLQLGAAKLASKAGILNKIGSKIAPAERAAILKLFSNSQQ